MTTRRHYTWGQIFWSGPTTSRWGIFRKGYGTIIRLGRFGLWVR
jgi:hypothetical protein